MNFYNGYLFVWPSGSCFAKLSQSFLISEPLQHDDLHESYLKDHLPNFLWLMRDSDLECKDDNGQKMSATDYVLQKILVTKSKGDTALSIRDRAVRSVRAIFPKIECLDIPSPGRGISKPGFDIYPDFYTSIDSAKQHVVSNTPVKLGFNRSTVLDGPMLAALLDEYVQALNKPGTLPNLEDSYQKVLEVTLTETSHDLAKKYNKQMSELLDEKLPLEEGDIEALKKTHSVRLEEGLKHILKMYSDPIATVKMTDTLFNVHERVYTPLLRCFTIELHRLIPETADTDEILKKDEQARITPFLLKFEQLIIKINPAATNVIGGYISRFTQTNIEKSESCCKEVFEEIYTQQIQKEAPKRKSLEAKYYEQAVGPAKDKVFQDMISQIPGPPKNVTVNLETKMLSWEKPLTNADAVNYYFVEWYREGKDPKRIQVHTTFFKFEKLKSNTNYFIKVQGFNDDKKRLGEYSIVCTCQTGAGKPEKPKKPEISPQTEETVQLIVTMLSEAEQNGSPVTEIIIKRSSNRNSTWEAHHFQIESSQGEFQRHALTVHANFKINEEILYFQVQFMNKVGLSEPSDYAELKVAEMIPGKPENIKAITMARQIQVTWDIPIINPGAVNSYLIQCWGEKGCEQELIARRDDRSLQVTSLSPYTEYKIRVYATNEKNSTANVYGTVNVQTLADVPDKPHPLTIKVTSASKATITFYQQKPDEENGSPVKNIYIEQQIKETEQATKWTVVKNHSLMDSNQSDLANINLPIELLIEPSISCYRVVTVNSIGRSEPSQAVEVNPENIFPGSPEELEATTIQSNSITINWKKTGINPLASKQYQIQHKKVKGGATCLSKIVDTHSCTVSELRPNTEYTFTVKALNGTLLSEEATLLVCTPPSVPPRPTPPILIPRGKEFILKAHLPPVEESGREVEQLHVNYHSYDTTTKQTMEFKIERREAIEDNTHEQQIQVNIDEICWISISLSNEVGKSQESDLVGLSYGDVTPGQPNKLECTTEARSVKLTWNVPRVNGNAAKHYELFIKDTKDHNWMILENASLHQVRLNETLYYEATVNDLSPFTTYQFGVQAVNNTTRNICVGDRSLIETTTNIAPPDKPLKPLTVEPIMGEPLHAKLQLKMLTKQLMNGSPVDSVIIECEYNEETICSEVLLTAEQQIENTNTLLTIGLPNIHDSQNKLCSFLIRMKNEAGESPPSDAFLFPVSDLQPGPPKNIKISDVTAHTLRVLWEVPNIHPALVTLYEVQYSAVQTHRNREAKSFHVKRDANEFTISNLCSNQKYSIKVIAMATKHSKPIHTNATTLKIHPGAPTSLVVDKLSSDSIKVRWRKPKENSEEVYFYTVKLRQGNYIKATEKQVHEENIPKVKQMRRTLGHSTVFNHLDSFKTYTVSVSSYNDNKETHENDATIHLVFETKMKTGARVALQVATIPTMFVPNIIGNKQKCDENIYPSDDEFKDDPDDDEFKDDPDIHLSAPNDLKWEMVGKNKVKIYWKQPIHNSEELHHFEVQVSEQGGGRILHDIESFGTSETFKVADLATKCYEVSVTSFNFYGEKGDEATLFIGGDSHTCT
ncbi:tyrosine-protein phosphatase Lar-like isoform X3 [Halichondria panicea]|uniref:tyrosine-protein phosphatase Lar-like isoform X3 n=1 Tax=Halichondria panicea TaxID=6063 RepID=UPI00312BA7AB